MAETNSAPKRPLAVTLGAAAATIIVVAAVLSGPTLINCASSPDGLAACFQNRLSEVGILPKPAQAIAEAQTAPAEAVPETNSMAAAAPAQIAPEASAMVANVPEPSAEPASEPMAATSQVEPAPAASEPQKLAAADPAAPAPPAQNAPVAQPAQTPPASESQPQVAEEQQDTDAPQITLLRAEPNGSLVIAGTGEPESELELFANDDSLGQTSVEHSGDWVFVPNAPLAAGEYEITIGHAGSGERSGNSMVVAIAEDKASEPLVVASTPGQASQVLQGLSRDDAMPAPQRDVRSPEGKAAEPAAPAVAPAAPPSKPDEQPVEIASAEPTPPAAQKETASPKFLADPTIDAIEIDGERNFFAGSGPDGANIRLYVDDRFIDETEVADGRWLIETGKVLTKPSQRIRIDMLAEGSADVAARAEVDFEVEVPAAAPPVVVAEAPAPIAQPTEPPAPAQAAQSATSTAALPEPEAEVAEAPSSDDEVPTMVGTRLGDPESQRFASGKAIIRRGDNLWTIARRVYGQGIRYTTIYEANDDQIRDPDRIYPGQVFDLPRGE